MDDNIDAEIFAHFSFELKVVRVIENIIVPAILKFKMEFIPMDVTDAELDHSFMKMRYWLDNVVHKCIVFSHENDTAIAMFIDENGGSTRVANVLMLTPEEPTDQHLAAIFQAKMQALAEDTLSFGPVEISSDNSLGLAFTFVGDPSTFLPTMKDWVGERTYFDQPWWNRNDGSTLDVLPPEDADLTVKPTWAFNFDFLNQPDKQVTSGVIVRPEFKPVVIDGGKSK